MTTVATPHQGTPIADFAIIHSSLYSLNDHRDAWGTISKLFFNPSKALYLHSLRVDRTGYSSEIFSAQDSIDNPEVAYCSFSASMNNIFDALPLELTQGIIKAELRKYGLDGSEYGTANDGVVPVYSMIYGEHLGSIDAHHWGSACMGLAKISPSCRRTVKVLMPHLQSLYSQAL